MYKFCAEKSRIKVEFCVFLEVFFSFGLTKRAIGAKNFIGNNVAKELFMLS